MHLKNLVRFDKRLLKMIPLKLQLKNFLSYGSDLQEVDFGPYNLICLSGKNGHGKSALLDAITWALWGQARKVSATSKPDEGLLRIGQRQMIVIFDFLFNGDRYRIRREFTSAYGKNYAYLDFALLNGEDENDVIALTAKTIRETQKKIEDVLGLDFDSFINSAFLKQGQSNEFSRKSPKERKEILANILGLNKFEALKKAALEKSKVLSNERDGILKIVEHIEKDLQFLPEINIQIEQTDRSLKEILDQEKNNQNLFSKLNLDQENLNKKNNELEILKVKVQQLNSNFIELKNRFLTLIEQWRSVHHDTLVFKDYDQIEKNKKELKKELDRLQERFTALYSLKEKHLIAKEQLANRLDLYEKKYSKLISEDRIAIDKLEFQEKSLKISKDKIHLEIQELYKLIDVFESKNKNLEIELGKELFGFKNVEELEGKFERRKEFYHTLVANGNSIKNYLKDIVNKKEMIADKKNPSCPLCLQNLSLSRKEYLQKQFATDEFFMQSRLNRIKKLIPMLKEYLLQVHNQVSRVKKINEEFKLNHSKNLDLQKELNTKKYEIQGIEKESKKIVESCKVYKMHLSDLEKEYREFTVKDKDYLSLKEAVDNLEKEIASLNYCEDVHKKLQNEFSDLDKKTVNFQAASEQKVLQRERSKIIADLSKSIRRCRVELDLLNTQEKCFQRLGSDKEALLKRQDLIKRELSELESKKEILFQEKGKLKSQKEKLFKLEQELKDYNKKLQELEKDVNDYKDISKALGKDGIQALLIEEAIPEIEQEANSLLSRLTNNQSQIFIESLRDLKKGGTKETLDIKISDSIGLRPYELFSGGEAFRIDFALRIAISKLLARRAGTSLQTLIIDEGFGSQDEEGLNNIMECIYRIQDDFEKVIIVSHLVSMKEQFPVHFMVTKMPTGSRIDTVECA
jgi:DNA repair protein SbcC/Rad50